MLRSVIQRFSKTSLSCTTTEITHIFKIVESIKCFLLTKAREFLARHQDEAVLVAVQGDGTWQRSKIRHKYGDADLSVRREGGAGHDVYLQRCFLKAHQDAMLLVDEPRHMTAGKTSWHCLEAYKTFCEFIRDSRAAHQHILIRFYCYDRLQFNKLLGLHRQEHRLESHELALLDTGLNENRLILTDWTTGRACADHDCQNALKWAADPLHSISASDTYDNMHIIVASIRNGFDIICRELPNWLASTVRFTDEAFPDCQQFWASLQVESTWIDELCELQLQFSEGVLKIKKELETDTHWVEKVSSVLMYIWNFKDFTATRWLTLGGTSKALTRSLATGLDALITTALQNGNSKYYLGGFSRLTSDLRSFVVTLSLCCYPADAFMLESLEDDRVAMRADMMRDAVYDELDYLCAIPDTVMDRLAHIGHTTAQPLRHAALSSALRSVAFMEWRIFSEADSLPWSLCRNDVAQNLRDLKSRGAAPTEFVARKNLGVLGAIVMANLFLWLSSIFHLLVMPYGNFIAPSAP